MADPTPPKGISSTGLRESTCLLCGVDNGCEVAAGKGTCWCFHAEVDGDLLDWLAERGHDQRCLCPSCASGDIPSPCVGQCNLDPASRSCSGCGRLLQEIASWSELDATRKAAVRLRLLDGHTSR